MAGFWQFWIYIYIDILVLVVIAGWFIWYNFFDTRLRAYIILANKQIKLIRKKIKNETITVYDKLTNTYRLYTVNRNFIYYRHGRMPYAFYNDNIPIPLDLFNDVKLSEEEYKTIKNLQNKNKQVDLPLPTRVLKSKKDGQEILIDTAETFFRLLYTNFTLNLIIPPRDFKKAVKWTVILIIIGIIVAILLHFLGVIDIMQILGAQPPE